MRLFVVLVVPAGGVLPEHLAEFLDGEAFPAGEEEQDGQRHPLAGEVEFRLVVFAFFLVRFRPVELERLTEDGGQGQGPRGEYRLVAAGCPVVGGLAGDHPVFVVVIEGQPFHAERALPQEGEFVRVHAEGGRGAGQAVRSQVACLVDLPAVLADPFGERGELAGHRRGARRGGELGQRKQADRRERVGQPERVLYVDVLVLEVVVGDVMVVVVSHDLRLSAGGRAGSAPRRIPGTRFINT